MLRLPPWAMLRLSSSPHALSDHASRPNNTNKIEWRTTGKPPPSLEPDGPQSSSLNIDRHPTPNVRNRHAQFFQCSTTTGRANCISLEVNVFYKALEGREEFSPKRLSPFPHCQLQQFGFQDRFIQKIESSPVRKIRSEESLSTDRKLNEASNLSVEGYFAGNSGLLWP